MKPHHRASLLLGCLGLLVLYLPDGLRVVGRWPVRPVLAAVPALPPLSAALSVAPTLSLGSGRLALPAGSRPTGVQALPSPEGPAPPLSLDDLMVERAGDRYAGGQ